MTSEINPHEALKCCQDQRCSHRRTVLDALCNVVLSHRTNTSISMSEQESTAPPPGPSAEENAAAPPSTHTGDKAVPATAEQQSAAPAPSADAPDPAAVDLAMQNEQTIAQTNAINEAISASQVHLWYVRMSWDVRFRVCG